ncbi:MAG: aminomethyl-transferring glycine dehydrogenase [Acidimicrobiales bacterium]|nr:aminomethyl-transferring glycine dehydrogenase [Acidimicrobiales bacterium]
MTTSLQDLLDAQRTDFIQRHIGPTPADVATMLEVLGEASLAALVDAAVPGSIRQSDPLDLPGPETEDVIRAEVADLAAQNQVLTSLIGAGYYGTITPPVILRNVLENPAWYTAYTPYQPEISQGRLEALLNFQTMLADLTGMDIANASMLDEATAAAEAMTLLHRVSKAKNDTFFVDRDCHPQTLAVIATRAEPLGLQVVTGDPAGDLPDEMFGALLQYPGSSGAIADLAPLVQAVAERGGKTAVAADILALVLLKSPGSAGADCVVGSTQRFGVPMGNGGPHAGYLATRSDYQRSLPGRLVGTSIDTKGRPAHRLALQTREQHIRREKATSNICTAQVLLANIAGLYACWHGPNGLRAIAQRVHRLTAGLATALRQAGFELTSGTYFDTITVRLPDRAPGILAAARDAGINLRPVDETLVGISLDETSTPEIVAAVLLAFGVTEHAPEAWTLPADLLRTDEILTHDVFNAHHSETEMLRYLRQLADKDIALDRSMIPLGSCTMKLNATTEMQPITWSGFADIHPFAPAEQRAGHTALADALEQMLVTITGYDAVSLQPNAGSQGEFAGLLAIAAYHRANGQPDRDLCLIPASAHGTNAASAVMAGMRVAVVECDALGNIDVDDLKRLLAEHHDTVAALMITYPSTHGVFEESVRDVCAMIHDAGGQVYLDGANLNAMVGVAQPGRFGADVSHLNLHKTFCIPHGGGGPGVGPVAVGAHLAPYLPGHPAERRPDSAGTVGPVSAAPNGSAGILPISYTYIRLMGGTGLTRATEVAICSANYIAKRLGEHYPVLYTGPNGYVAHECILDLRPLREETGVTVDDVAKRLIDYGFHAPTMSFPVAGTLMVEPTESESLAELDRFCDAMIAIKSEIDQVGAGTWPADDNPLVNAPHTADDVAADEWPHPYSRTVAAYPVESLRRDKYWSPVSRIDGVHGDRNLVCACTPIDAYR